VGRTAAAAGTQGTPGATLGRPPRPAVDAACWPARPWPKTFAPAACGLGCRRQLSPSPCWRRIPSTPQPTSAGPDHDLRQTSRRARALAQLNGTDLRSRHGAGWPPGEPVAAVRGARGWATGRNGPATQRALVFTAARIRPQRAAADLALDGRGFDPQRAASVRRQQAAQDGRRHPQRGRANAGAARVGRKSGQRLFAARDAVQGRGRRRCRQIGSCPQTFPHRRLQLLGRPPSCVASAAAPVAQCRRGPISKRKMLSTSCMTSAT
jgi:hypothetical protein